MNTIWLKNTDSTNLHAIRNRWQAEDLTLWSAEYQSAGKGQRGNKWESAEGENLTFTILLRPIGLQANRQFAVFQIASLAVVDYLKKRGVRATIKWPNDIYVGEKKICGMLIENFLSGDKLAESIVGIGININQIDFPPEIPNPTSLIIEGGKSIKYDRKVELEEFVSSFEEIYLPINTQGKWDSEELFEEYTNLLFRKGEFARYYQTEYYKDGDVGEIYGKIVGVEKGSARLLIELENGQLRKYFFKEISYIL
mgnify:FL=1